MIKSLVYGTLALLLIGGICTAAPEPAIIPAPGDWTLEVKFEHPQPMILGVASGRPQRFWYAILTLTNKARKDVDFYPQCELMTDTFEIIPAGRGTPAAVFERVKRRHQSKYPFLEPLDKAGNEILQGKDNAKDIAIIWPDFSDRARSMKLFIMGLSNETVAIDHPVAKDDEGNPVKVYLRKTLELSYSLGGEPVLRSDTKVTPLGKRWVMR